MKKAILILIAGLLLSSNAYAGCIKGNCINGQGTYTYSNGSKYVGEFKDGKSNGQGTVTFANGNKYVGGFKDDKYHGHTSCKVLVFTKGPRGGVVKNMNLIPLD